MKKFFTHADLIVPAHHPRVLVETAAAQGANRPALLEGTSITERMLESPDARFSYTQFALLARNAIALTKNPALGLDFGRNIRLPQMGLLGLALMSSSTVGAALRSALRHYRMLSPAFELGLSLADERAVLTVRETIPLEPYSVFATDSLVVAFDTQGRELCGHALPVRAVRFAHSRPAHAGRYREIYDIEPSFDHGTTEVEFDASLLDSPLAGADPATAALAEQYCDKQMAAFASIDGLVAQMRRLINSTEGRPPDLEHLARKLQTSARTLRRSLQSMSTSYSELLDESRKTRAEEWVRGTPMTFEHIAHELGFSNARSFRRAFKRWTGSTPGAMRAVG
jgi:AraC-like DNA-binding protein